MNSRCVLATAFAMGLFAACDSPRLLSQWRTGAITIDGSDLEWDNILEYPADINPNIGIGIVNDNDYLYLCITSDDKATVSKILMAGFTLAFKSPSDKTKLFGIHFPLGMKMTRIEGEKGDPEAMKARMEASLQMLALLGPGKNDTVFMPVERAESSGVVVRVSPSMDQCTYELKVPLKRTALTPYAISAGKDSAVTITFETGEMTRPAGKPPMGDRGGPPGGGGMPPHVGQGFGGGSSGGGPGGGGPPPGGSHDMQEPLKVTCTLQFSRSPSTGR
jgi:hypothetical protein